MWFREIFGFIINQDWEKSMSVDDIISYRVDQYKFRNFFIFGMDSEQFLLVGEVILIGVKL